MQSSRWKYFWKSCGIALFCSLCINCYAQDIKASQNLHVLENNFTDVIRRSKPAVVYLQVRKKSVESDISQKSIATDPVLKDFFGDRLPSGHNGNGFAKLIFGSGFFISSNGYIATNSHIVRDAQHITVILADKTQHQAQIIGEDKWLDVALLKIDGNNFPHLSFSKSDNLRVGSWVLAIGSPYKYIQTATAGIISATSRNSVGVSGYEHFIQTDAAINPGNSGGPLLNIDGEVVGINTAFMTRTGGYMGVGFAIPATMAQKITRQLKRTGKVIRGWMGVRLLDVDRNSSREQAIVKERNLVRIIKIVDKSPAKQAGLRIGDLLCSVDDSEIISAADFRNQISLYEPGTKVKIGFYRGGQYMITYTILGTFYK